MKSRNGILTVLAVLALVGCSVDTAPTEPSAVPNLSAGGITTLGSGNSATPPDTTAAAQRNIIILGSGS